MGASKTDLEIYNLAANLLNTITIELEEAQYTRKNGSLSMGWSDSRAYNAGAISHTAYGSVPLHNIVINYEMARQIYRDAEDFCELAKDPEFASFLQGLPGDLFPNPILPEIFTDEDCVKNMFFAGITWVYFHELGHLVQEHGFLRGKSEPGSNAASISELEARGDIPLVGQEAVIAHATELAADCEATVWCVTELLRHFTDDELIASGQNRLLLVGCIFLFICSLACVFYRFNGGQIVPANPVPSGSHPNAIFRLECALPQIYELLDILGKRVGHNLSRKELVEMAKRAADLASMFWYFKHSDRSVALPEMLVKGLLNRPEFKEYAQQVIAAWDSVLPKVREVRHFGVRFGILDFDEAYRRYLRSDSAS
jgi:hypothetical protein